MWLVDCGGSSTNTRNITCAAGLFTPTNLFLTTLIIMRKLSHLSLTLLLVLPVLAGCSHMQTPTKEQTLTGPGDGTGLPGYNNVQPGSDSGEPINSRDASLSGDAMQN